VVEERAASVVEEARFFSVVEEARFFSVVEEARQRRLETTRPGAPGRDSRRSSSSSPSGGRVVAVFGFGEGEVAWFPADVAGIRLARERLVVEEARSCSR
jgi:hypothetical protein